jgi:hypothetical protein
MTGLGEAALAYAAAGYAVFPLRGKLPFGNCPACEPRSPRYRPHEGTDCRHELCHGLYAATCDPVRVGRWWGRWPRANIGGRVPANLLVVDVDPRHGGLARLAELERDHGPLPPTRASISGRGDGGQHLWFLHPGGRLSAARLGAGVDLKTHRGYVLLPPSRHPATSQPYRWAEPTLAPAALPAGWRRLLSPVPPSAPAARRPNLPPGRSGSVAEAFNQATSWTQVLGPHGWSCPDPDPDADGARWRHQPQERHHPPQPAVHLLPGHPLRPHRARGTPRLQPLPRLRGAGTWRGPARRRPSPQGRNPVTTLPVPPLPTAQPVDGASLLAELRQAFTRYVVLPSPQAADAVTLWTAATHAQPAWEHAPRLAVVSPLKRCGKSRLPDVVAETCHAPLITINYIRYRPPNPQVSPAMAI